MASKDFSTRRAAVQEQQDKKRAAVTRRWLLAKQTIWLALLALAFLIFLLLDILNESLSLF